MENNLIKVLIVDDEYLIRSLLKKCIDWNAIGMEIVAEADSGEEAIELTDQYNPDLVFTDICMSNMDGIEFANYIIKKYPKIKVVAISGYEDFKYAQRSIKAGLKDYILKPIDDEVVRSIALKMKKEIKEERERLFQYDFFKEQLVENYDFFLERFLNRLIKPDIGNNKIKRHKSLLDFTFRSDMFEVIVIDIVFNSKGDQANDIEKIVCVTKAHNLIKIYFEEAQDIYVFFDMNYRITIINNSLEDVLEESINKIKTTILNKFNYVYNIGIGTRKRCIENIEKSYKEALKDLNDSKKRKPNKLIADIRQYMQLNLEDPELSLTKIAHLFFISSSYLSRIFKKETGISFIDYLTKLRIDEAMLLLKNTDLMVYEVSEKVGIFDPNYFSTCFKKYTGLSPSEYRGG